MIYELGQANRLGNRETNQDRFAAIETEEGALLVAGPFMDDGFWRGMVVVIREDAPMKSAPISSAALIKSSESTS